LNVYADNCRKCEQKTVMAWKKKRADGEICLHNE
jgi:ribosomal protein L40E